ncbi:hypothetical protein ANOM_006655 [Aspergillus nomiae NRRL 13137]|uniref:Uncharacterized protein n=1 Tax=Aspergillus nomiae NRRL (strain ATCC 15546 / NRRL 13137 / CBS 260.88 / M93) TaxID=1509407 RepID=A0A0L1J185_ASPN3|nr:uncharacterized protein ANOM_006655 [Aspergillus nomiae NRRL 13137]KNG85566.1 hypothetical protein ANOM_006655 [Aspergillus nomiae NRRL 13137]
MAPAQYKARRDYAKELHIDFLGYAPPVQWPDAHRSLFEDIQKLGNQKYSSFSETVSNDSIEKPWRHQTKQRAARLVRRSTMSRNDRKNEAGWRFSIEPEVLYRFTVEVTCPRCRSRLWKSEIEAAVSSSQPFAQSLEARRRHREPCQCVDQWGYNSGYGDGVNMVFSDRAEAAIKHDPPLPIQGRRRGQVSEEPDRVYGLRDTGSLRDVLNSINRHTVSDGNFQSLRETIEVSPFDDEGEQLLFPFLIMEAKSGKNGDMAAVEMQTGFCIRRLLKLQHELGKAGEYRCGTFEPLVWFLSWSGEQWNVAGCFVKETQSHVEWLIVKLWGGDVTSMDGSLQLLLIIDYIVDWARDVYRESLLAQLRSLSEECVPDSDSVILSTFERGSTVSTYRSDDPADLLSQTLPQSVVSSGDFLNLIHAEGVVRDASVIDSRFMALYITERDVEPFSLSFASEETYQESIAKMSTILKDSWRLVPDALNGIEEAWTGTSRPATCRDAPDRSPFFFVGFTFRMFVASDWQPVRQLVCLAISSMAVVKIWGSEMLNVINSGPIYTDRETERFLNFLKGSSVMDTLAAAISMQCLSNTSRRRGGPIASSLSFKRDDSTSVLELVSLVLKSHTIGRRLSPDPYLRCSHMQSKQSIFTDGPKVWPQLDQLMLHPNGTILVDSEQQSPSIPRRCLYIVDGSYEYGDAAGLVERMSYEGTYYSTVPLCPNHDPAEYFPYMNRPLDHARYWRIEKSLESFQHWISALQEHTSICSTLHGSSSSPILLLSSDEASSDDDEDDGNETRQITVAWKEEH